MKSIFTDRALSSHTGGLRLHWLCANYLAPAQLRICPITHTHTHTQSTQSIQSTTLAASSETCTRNHHQNTRLNKVGYHLFKPNISFAGFCVSSTAARCGRRACVRRAEVGVCLFKSIFLGQHSAINIQFDRIKWPFFASNAFRGSGYGAIKISGSNLLNPAAASARFAMAYAFSVRNSFCTVKFTRNYWV